MNKITPIMEQQDKNFIRMWSWAGEFHAYMNDIMCIEFLSARISKNIN